MKLTGAFLVVCGVLSAQGLQNQPIYRVTVTSRTAKAISYQHRSGSTKIDFRDPIAGGAGDEALFERPDHEAVAGVAAPDGAVAIEYGNFGVGAVNQALE